jgi:hypothetical protein
LIERFKRHQDVVISQEKMTNKQNNDKKSPFSNKNIQINNDKDNSTFSYVQVT